MGNTCSTVKKSKDSKSNDRKESSESIPYGQQQPDVSNVECDKSNTAIDPTANAQQQQQSGHLGDGKSSTTSPTPCPPASSSTSSSAVVVGPSPSTLQTTASTVPTSLSPEPTASTPSPYSTMPYSSNGGGASAYQNISPTKGHISLCQYSETIRASSFTQLFHLRSDLNEIDQTGLEDYYVIAASTESDELVVWSVYEQKPVRTLKNIPRPRDVRMVDQFQAVVLCNRELMLYDLNQAKLVTKLKGVMNQKMPYYGLHNEKLVVALSRNRMYVNMINLDTGDLETTFKAGEDRFLNSLLTSANGKICVCGDETQKPFPLLVWDLSNRKLLYDLRIPHHEFLTKLSAISDDGHYVVCVSQECQSTATNFLIVYDLQSGTLFKKWKPECDSVSVAISTQCGGCVINGIINNDVLVWDLSTGNIKYTLSGHSAPPDLLQPALKSNIFLSYNSSRKDDKLCIWSLEEGTCLWTFVPEKEISCCCLTPNGMGIIYGFVGEKVLQLSIRDDDNKSLEENEQDNNAYIEQMIQNTIPYGDGDLASQIIDLKKL